MFTKTVITIWSTTIFLLFLSLGQCTNPENADINKLFSLTFDSDDEMLESARKSGTPTNLTIDLETLRRSLESIRSHSPANDGNLDEKNLENLKNAIEAARKSGVAIDNSPFDIATVDLNRIERKLLNLENEGQPYLNDTRKQILYPPEHIRYWYQIRKQDPDKPKFLKQFREFEELRRASRYVMKTKLCDMMLQLIFMARHKIKYLERNKEWQTVDTSFRIAFLYKKMILIRRKMLQILSTEESKHEPNYERDSEPFDFVEIYLIYHHKAMKLHVDFVYLYKLLMKIDNIYREKHGDTTGLTVPLFYRATATKHRILPTLPELPLTTKA